MRTLSSQLRSKPLCVAFAEPMIKTSLSMNKALACKADCLPSCGLQWRIAAPHYNRFAGFRPWLAQLGPCTSVHRRSLSHSHRMTRRSRIPWQLPEASAALAAVWGRLHACLAPPEPPLSARFLPARRGHAVLCPPGHAAPLCMACGRLFRSGRGVDTPCQRGVLAKLPVAALLTGRWPLRLLGSMSGRRRRRAGGRSLK